MQSKATEDEYVDYETFKRKQKYIPELDVLQESRD